MKRVIYIAGSGRTATTMWSILISSQLGIPNLSQSRDYFRAVVNNKACSCGQSVSQCYEVGRRYVEKSKYKRFPRFLMKLNSFRFTIAHLCQELSGKGYSVNASKSVKHLLLVILVTRKRPLVIEFQRSEIEIEASWRVLRRSEAFISHIKRKNSRRKKILTLLASLRIIEKHTYDFNHALSNSDAILRTLSSKLNNVLVPQFRSGVYLIPANTQHIFPPADPKYLSGVTEIRIKSR